MADLKITALSVAVFQTAWQLSDNPLICLFKEVCRRFGKHINQCEFDLHTIPSHERERKSLERDIVVREVLAHRRAKFQPVRVDTGRGATTIVVRSCNVQADEEAESDRGIA